MPKHALKSGSLKGGKHKSFSKAKIGSGGRFRSCVRKMSSRGARNPRALCASIGRAKYGKKRFTKMAVKGRMRKKK